MAKRRKKRKNTYDWWVGFSGEGGLDIYWTVKTKAEALRLARKLMKNVVTQTGREQPSIPKFDSVHISKWYKDFDVSDEAVDWIDWRFGKAVR